MVAAEVPEDPEELRVHLQVEPVVQEAVATQEIQQQEPVAAEVLVAQAAEVQLDQEVQVLEQHTTYQVLHHPMIDQEPQTQAAEVDQVEDLQDPLLFYMEAVVAQEL